MGQQTKSLSLVACRGSARSRGGISMGRMRRALQQRLPVAAGTTTLIVFLAAAILLPKTTSEVLRDSAFDLELAEDQWLRRPAPPDLKVIVVDIDRASIDTLGAWPWPRETIARLVEAVATGRPAAIAIDALFAEPDDRSPAALARRLGSVTGRAESVRWEKACRMATSGWRERSAASPSRSALCSIPIMRAHCRAPRSRAAGRCRSTICGRPGRDRAGVGARGRGERARRALIAW